MAKVFTSGGVAIITGGASGIGLALAKKCQGYGMRVLIADKNETSLESARNALNGDIAVFKMDVGRLEDWSELKASVDRDFAG
jgi:short-subunit dehydrogenase involved in D-alanine esterification of teichoic acids